FALSTTNGARRWARLLDAIDAEPVVCKDAVYVYSRSNILYKLDAATGSTIWQYAETNRDSGLGTRLTADLANGRVYTVDYGLHAYLDTCAMAIPLWNYRPPGATVSAVPVTLATDARYVYVSDTGGKLWQVNGNSGEAVAWASISGGAAASYDP